MALVSALSLDHPYVLGFCITVLHGSKAPTVCNPSVEKKREKNKALTLFTLFEKQKRGEKFEGIIW